MTKEDFEAMILELVPEKYQPKEGAIVSSISMVEHSIIESFLGLLKKDSVTSATTGLCINWGLLHKEMGAPDWEKELQNNAIFVDENLWGGSLHTAFVLLHEVGHVNWAVERNKLSGWQEADKETYCDFYATSILREKYGEECASTLATLFASKPGPSISKGYDA